MGCKYRILSGMLILAYQYFEQYEPAVLCDWQNYLVKRLEVCEGQQWDV
jgi:geranylgeranyl diphosphate synthase type II